MKHKVYKWVYYYHCVKIKEITKQRTKHIKKRNKIAVKLFEKGV